MTAPILSIRGLRIDFSVRAGWVVAVDGVDLDVHPGECVAVVGESGSGKSSVALAALGLAPANAEVAAERLELFGEDVGDADEAVWRRLRGARAGLVLQDALVSLDPLRSIGSEVAETLRLHRIGPRAEVRDRARAAMTRAGLHDPAALERRRAVELSGGMRQRSLIASAIAAEPGLVIADEPTTALDAVVQSQIIDTLAELRRRGTGVLLISHDLGLVARAASRVLVMREGRVVEEGPASRVLDAPEHAYTRELVALRPRIGAASAIGEGSAIAPGAAATGAAVDLVEVGKRYRRDGRTRTVLDGVTLHVAAGESVGIVGPSGGGKSTIARIAAGLLPVDAGDVAVAGAPPLRRGRPSPVQLVPQDSTSSFDPRWTVERIVGEGLDAAVRPRPRGAERRRRLEELMDDVGLDPSVLDRRAERLSGGQRQRVSIARAIAARPRVLVCDESVAALDVAVQTRIVRLLARLRAEHGFTLLFISHDLGVVSQLCDRVVVVADGRIVEEGPLERLFSAPEHPVTAALVAESLSHAPAPGTETS